MSNPGWAGRHAPDSRVEWERRDRRSPHARPSCAPRGGAPAQYFDAQFAGHKGRAYAIRALHVSGLVGLRYLRDDTPGRHTTNPAHTPKAHQHRLRWTPSRLIQWAETIGPRTAALVAAILAERPHPEQGYRSCLGLLRLGRLRRRRPARGRPCAGPDRGRTLLPLCSLIVGRPTSSRPEGAVAAGAWGAGGPVADDAGDRFTAPDSHVARLLPSVSLARRASPVAGAAVPHEPGPGGPPPSGCGGPPGPGFRCSRAEPGRRHASAPPR